MALSLGLEQNKTPATRITTDAACTIEQADGGFKISKMALTVRGVVPNIDDATFKKIAEETKKGCPVSKAIAGNVDITLDASLTAS
jgi:osmotically inducible protein OsmC